jgi:pimeloyl-ACP methyl ester carboxylesterase
MDTYGLTGQLRMDTQWAAQSRAGVQFLVLSKATVRVRVSQSAKPGARTVVFAADPPCGIEHFDGLFERLSPDYNVVCYEQPGFGFSKPHRNFRFSPDDYTQTLAELLQTLRLGLYTLAFECVAVYPALQVAARQPELIDGLFLMQAPVWAEEQRWVSRVDPQGHLSRPVLGQLAMAFSKEKLTNIWYKLALKDRTQLPQFRDVALEGFKHRACYCLASMFQAWGEVADYAPAKPIEQPAMVVWGNGDKTHLPTDKRSILQYVPNAHYEEWDDAGHFPELEQTERFVQKLTDFIQHR